MPREKLALGQNSTEIMSSDKSNSAAMFLRIQTDIYTIFPGLEVRIVKNCDRGVENSALGLWYHLHYLDRP